MQTVTAERHGGNQRVRYRVSCVVQARLRGTYMKRRPARPPSSKRENADKPIHTHGDYLCPQSDSDTNVNHVPGKPQDMPNLIGLRTTRGMNGSVRLI